MPDSHRAAADTLRTWALDESLKHRVMSDPVLAELAGRVAGRYTAGESIDDAITAARASIARGHAVSLEYTGESVRNAAVADAETEVFLDLADRVRAEDLPATVSLDLTHVGALIDPAQGLRNAGRIASMLGAAGRTLMISAEGSDRTDLVLDIYERLAGEHGAAVGITIQARLHRSPADLDRVLGLPGRVRLVKGAFAEPAAVALPRETAELDETYLRMAERLVEAAHPTSIATHDDELIRTLLRRLPHVREADDVEFEMLLGLGTTTLDRLHQEGYRTREYAIFGGEWWLYVLNRIAERPERLYDAVIDLAR